MTPFRRRLGILLGAAAAVAVVIVSPGSAHVAASGAEQVKAKHYKGTRPSRT
jgi:hypothetical protein